MKVYVLIDSMHFEVKGVYESCIDCYCAALSLLINDYNFDTDELKNAIAELSMHNYVSDICNIEETTLYNKGEI
jgi:hypothetical protein